MSKPKIDGANFHRRLRLLVDKWNEKAEVESDNTFSGANSILILSADPDKQPQYSKCSTLQTWLLGFEFPKTAIVLSRNKAIFLTSGNKAAHLESLKDNSIENAFPVEIMTFTKDEASMKAKCEELIQTLTESEYQPIGFFPKDKVVGGFYDMWQKIKANHSDNWKEVDVTVGVAEALSFKDETELKLMQLAGKTTVAMAKYMVKQVVAYADKGESISHSELSRKVEDLLFNTNKLTKLDIQAPIDFDLLDWAHNPCIQSGGVYDLKGLSVSDKQNLHFGVIICSLGVRYHSYCTYEARTLFINATKQQEENYKFLLETYNHTLNRITAGMKLSQIYAISYDYIAENRPDLESKFNKHCGFVTGIEFRESSHVISPKSNQILEDNTCLIFMIGFTDLENPEANDSKGKKYSLCVADTIKVTAGQPSLLTTGGRKITDICYSFNDTTKPSKQDKSTSENGKAANNKSKNSAILQSKFRSQAQEEETPEQRRRAHQQELFEKKNLEGLKRYQDDGGDGAIKDNKAIFKSFESYKRETAIPKEVRSNNIVVDSRNETVILPINGYPTPFHINTIKNVSKNDEGNMVYLRVNFVTPGQGVSKKDDMPFPNPEANFIRAMTYRSSDTSRLTEIYKRITDLKKEIAKKETEKKEMADIVEQDKLIVVPGRKPPHLSDIYIRPVLEGKKHPGELEIHSNGIRFLLPRSNRPLDILYSNIKHFFFQPCDGELLVLLHFHLKNPIMIGKKKTKDVQFYRETSDVTFDETGNRRRQHFYGDDDEMEAELEEKRMMQALNKEFQDFGHKIADASHGQVDLDIPFRELGFHGVPFRSSVLLQPTTECLVFLSDMPFLVITLDEIELAHLERVQFGLKNFDLVLVFKDFSKTPVHINTISTKDLEGLKEWLDSVDVMYTEGQLNLNWTTIMKTIRDDPAEFFETGGWSFLAEQAEDDVSSEEPESEYAPESEEDYQSESESNFDSDESSHAESEPTESEEDYDDEDEDERPRKKVAKPAPSARNGKRPTQSSTLPLKKMKR